MRILQILDQKEMPKKARAALLSGRGPDTTDWEIVYHVYLGVLQPGRPGSMANMVISTPRGRMDYIKKNPYSSIHSLVCSWVLYASTGFLWNHVVETRAQKCVYLSCCTEAHLLACSFRTIDPSAWIHAGWDRSILPNEEKIWNMSGSQEPTQMLTSKLCLLGSHYQRPLAHTRCSLGITNEDRDFSHHAAIRRR